MNLTSYLLTEDVVDVWIAAGNISSNVQSLLMAIETVAEALVDVANQSASGIVTIVTENIGEEYCSLRGYGVASLCIYGFSASAKSS